MIRLPSVQTDRVIDDIILRSFLPRAHFLSLLEAMPAPAFMWQLPRLPASFDLWGLHAWREEQQ